MRPRPMARPPHAHPLARWSLPLAAGLLIVTALLPARWLGWAGWFSAQAFVVVSPIAHPITRAADLIIPATRAGTEATERERTLQDELDRVRVRLLQSDIRIAELESIIEQLRGSLLHPDIEVTQLQRPIAGQRGELILVRTGMHEGVHRGAVITAQSVQLIGRVSEASELTVLVRPITARGLGQTLMGVVILDEQTGRRATCILRPNGDGTLSGEISPPEDGRAEEIQVGQTVRLFDDQWPRHAQMLVIGEIVRVEASAAQPLRRQITVQPRVNPRRAGEVIVRLPAPGSGG